MVTKDKILLCFLNVSVVLLLFILYRLIKIKMFYSGHMSCLSVRVYVCVPLLTLKTFKSHTQS